MPVPTAQFELDGVFGLVTFIVPFDTRVIVVGPV